MAKKDKSQQAQSVSGASSQPVEHAIGGRLYNSDTELEQAFDARHDISKVDCQEGTMNHGSKGGCFDDCEEPGFSPA